MPKGPDELVEKAYELYKGDMALVDIAKKLGKPDSTIRRWKSTYRWDGERSPDASERTEKKANARKESERKRAEKKEIEQVMKNDSLNDKQKLFCLTYIRCFNATKAYQRAYGCGYDVANAEGYKLLVKPCVKEEIMRLKQNRLNREFLDESDIFQKYMDIAFCDITEFVEFGRESVQVMAMYGPVEVKDPDTGEKIPLMKEVNIVKFRNAAQVDGTIITEVKQGKDGASIKLADRMKALQWLSDHMDLATDEQRAKMAVYKKQAEGNTIDEENTGVVVLAPVLEEEGEDDA